MSLPQAWVHWTKKKSIKYIYYIHKWSILIWSDSKFTQSLEFSDVLSEGLSLGGSVCHYILPLHPLIVPFAVSSLLRAGQQRRPWFQISMTTTPAQSGSGWLGSATSTQSPASRPKTCLACAPSWSPWNSPRWSVRHADPLGVSYYIMPLSLLIIQPNYSYPTIIWILKRSGLLPLLCFFINLAVQWKVMVPPSPEPSKGKNKNPEAPAQNFLPLNGFHSRVLAFHLPVFPSVHLRAGLVLWKVWHLSRERWHQREGWNIWAYSSQHHSHYAVFSFHYVFCFYLRTKLA